MPCFCACRTRRLTCRLLVLLLPLMLLTLTMPSSGTMVKGVITSKGSAGEVGCVALTGKGAAVGWMPCACRDCLTLRAALKGAKKGKKHVRVWVCVWRSRLSICALQLF
jgi:hypothetical protein